MNDREEPRREKLSGVIAMGLGLLLITLAVASLLNMRTRSIDGAALLAERFEVGELPFGYEVTRATRLPQGEEMVVFADPNAPAEEPPAAPATPDVTTEKAEPASEDDQEEGGGKGHGREKGKGPNGEEFDWGTLEDGEPGTQPVEVAFVWYAPKSAEKVLSRLFGRVEFQDLANVDWDGGDVIVDSGPLEWAGYTTHFIRRRHFARENGKPIFHETARVNLSVRNSCCVVYMRWLRGKPGSEERIVELLDAIRPLEEARSDG